MNQSQARNQWPVSTSHLESTEMARFPSQDSLGAHSQRTNSASSTTDFNDQNRSMLLFPSASQTPFHMSSARSDITDRSASPANPGLYTPTQQMDLQAFDNFQYADGADFSGSSFHGETAITNPSVHLSLNTGSSFDMFATSADGTPYTPPMTAGANLWDTNFLESQGSSPVEEYLSLPGQMMSPLATTPLEYSPNVEARSSARYVRPGFTDLDSLSDSAGDRTVRKAIGPRQSKVASDMANSRQPRAGNNQTSEESFKLVGRSSLDFDNTARDHPLYQNVSPSTVDGLYHCPWEGSTGCQHKAEKLKCNYEYDSFA